MGGATISKVRERSEQKKFFDPPTFCLPGGIKQDDTVFITAIMTCSAYAHMHQMIITVVCVTIMAMARLKL